MTFDIAIDDPRADDARALLAVHLTEARAQTPAEYAFALDADQLVEPSITFLSAREAGSLLPIGLDPEVERGPGVG